MISGRMFKIIRFLNKERKSNYKELCAKLDIKERNARYDIDCINDALSMNGYLEIEKHSKGKLIVPDDLDLDVLLADDAFALSAKERIDVIRFIVLFDTKNLNIKKLSEKFGVTRRSIQNDLNIIMKDFSPYHLELAYQRKFTLIEEQSSSYFIKTNELKKYVQLFNKKEYEYSPFELEIIELTEKIFKPVNVKQIFYWLNTKIKKMNWFFSDTSFDWYVANVLVTCLYILTNQQLPICPKKIDIEDYSLNELEEIIKMKLDENQKALITSYSSYTNKYGDVDINLDLIMTEDIIMQLLSLMSNQLKIAFIHDMILIKGLLNHVAPMLERIKNNIRVYEINSTVVPQNYNYIYKALKFSTIQIPELKNASDDELIYLTIHFIGSIQRMQVIQEKNILLICGLGYGATALVKDTLRNEYQIQVIDSISAYDLDNYNRWNEVDLVITTTPITLPVNKKVVNVNVIFSTQDHEKLLNAGVSKKNVLTNYIAIEKKLDFLSNSDRQKVITVIKEELGYKDVRIPKKYSNLSDLLGYDCIEVVDKFDEWQNAVQMATDLLVENGSVLSGYYDDIIKQIKTSGFYSVTDGKFALFHAGDTSLIKVSLMSLIVSKKPIYFENKKVNVLFCLSSKDKKEHIPVVVKLMRMVNKTNLIECLKECNDKNEIIEVIKKCEMEV